MSNKTFPQSLVTDALDAMGRDEHDVLDRNYGFDGVFGLKDDHPSFMAMFTAELALEIHRRYDEDDAALHLEQLVNLMDVARTESVGRGLVFTYFPGWTLGED